MIILTRRKLFTFLAAPAIVRATSIMPIKELLEFEVQAVYPINTYLTIQEITREAMRLFTQTNQFLRNIDSQYIQPKGPNHLA